MHYDLLIKGGRVIDPGQGLDATADVALTGGRVAAVAPAIPVEAGLRVVDAAGKLVLPGLIDTHVHVYQGATALGIEADTHCLAKGVTTALDAGSAGAVNIDAFRRFCVEPARGRILALLNISSIGMPFGVDPVQEVSWLPLADVDSAVAAVERHRGLVLGLKVRLSREIVWENGLQPMHRALEAGRRTGLPIMVHPGNTPVPLAEILDLMRPGDILTHTYTGHGCITADEKDMDWHDLPERNRRAGMTILDADGRVIPQAWAARERGVIMDVGHGRGSFAFAVCAPALEQGFTPDTMGSDLHSFNRLGPVYDQPTMISRFLGLGLSLTQIVEAATERPARVLGLAGEIGTLRPGAVGDVAIMELLDGQFEYHDAPGRALWGHQRLSPWMTVRAGEIVDCRPSEHAV